MAVKSCSHNLFSIITQISLFLPTPVIKRKQPIQRISQENEMQSYHDLDIISTFDDLNQNQAPTEFLFSKH